MATKTKGVSYLPVTIECWNCTNSAPTHDNGHFKFLAIKPDLNGRHHNGEEILGEMRQICAECFHRGVAQGGYATSLGLVIVTAQLEDGTVELQDGELNKDVCGCGMPWRCCAENYDCNQSLTRG